MKNKPCAAGVDPVHHLYRLQQHHARLSPAGGAGFVPVPVQIGDKVVMLGVGIVKWDVPKELNAAYLELERQKQQAGAERRNSNGIALHRFAHRKVVDRRARSVDVWYLAKRVLKARLARVRLQAVRCVDSRTINSQSTATCTGGSCGLFRRSSITLIARAAIASAG
jgi:hypothetical protein